MSSRYPRARMPDGTTRLSIRQTIGVHLTVVHQRGRARPLGLGPATPTNEDPAQLDRCPGHAAPPAPYGMADEGQPARGERPAGRRPVVSDWPTHLATSRGPGAMQHLAVARPPVAVAVIGQVRQPFIGVARRAHLGSPMRDGNCRQFAGRRAGRLVDQPLLWAADRMTARSTTSG